MKTKISFICLLIFTLNSGLKAQYITIPDANFVTYLQTNFPSCMNGNQMDTTCANIQNTTVVDVQWLSINDLTGIKYFINLQELYCNSNYLTSLPTLPNSLQIINCGNNQLASIQNLPNSLTSLFCSFNQITNIQSFPNSLLNLYCSDNWLTNLPTLPSSLQYLDCSNNYISCFPLFPNTLTDFTFLNIFGNPFTCLPNYPNYMFLDPVLLSYPLCVYGDTINNQNGCVSAEGIVGYAFKDNTSNCIKDSTDQGSVNVPLKLYDTTGNQLMATYSLINGVYNFNDTTGTYTVIVDTTGMPFYSQCIYPGIDSTVTLTTSNPLASNINFDIACKPGFDVGVQSVITSGWVFPGIQHQLNVVAGDMSSWYNLNCASGISGQVQITITGTVVFDSIASGSLTPTIIGNVFTYNIADFANVNMQQDFGLLFTTDSTAQTGDTICVNVIVTPSIGDYNLNNNSYQFCYEVSNSYDPNFKEVYPVNVQPGFQDWFTYTIHFQNTGNAPAMNIRLVDTLNNNLDLESFQVINYSHYNTFILNGNLLTFRFPNIQLPDSTSNSEGSKGFVQYRVKPKANLALGTQIENKANIYFDYNSPVVTNTTINEYTLLNSINESEINILRIYPNPFNSSATIQLNNKVDNAELIIFDLLGQKLKAINHISEGKVVINRENFSNGIYFIRLTQGNKLISTGKLIITD